MEYNETRGTHLNTQCPYCGKYNHHVSDGVHVVCGEVKLHEKPCHHCGETVYYQFSHEIVTVAATENLIKRLRGPEKDLPNSDQAQEEEL